MAKPRVPKKSNGAHDATPTPPVTTSTTTNQTVAEKTAVKQASQPEPPKAQSKKTRKPEIVKPDSRSNLVPINMDDEIRRLAYLLSERRGFEPGHEAEDWLTAEHEVLERYHQQSA
jgi:Protein of unknown function (DUF2934)